MMEGGVSITLQDCGKTFGDGTRALTPVSLEIARGETVVLLGPSGCGKTTILRMIAGLIAPDKGGKILFDGRDVTGLPIERRNVGMVFQSYALFPNMNVIDNVAYGLKVKGLRRKERSQEAMEILEMMHLQEFAARSIDQLSGGQKQRVALARAIAVKPNALLLDEPLTALDASLREELRSEIDRLLRKLGITAVYVTHDQAEAMVLADRVFVMDKGRIAQIGSPREIYFKPGSAFVAGFVGTMNRLDGAIKGGVFETNAGKLLVQKPDSARASAYFRPEHAELVEPETAPLKFIVEQIQFLGQSQRLILQTAENNGPPVLIETANRLSYARGQAVGLKLDPADLLFLT
jgi:putative spermidine/putrescine transport system ATP-binding protein